MLKPKILAIASALLLYHVTWSQKKFNLSVYTGSGISFFDGPAAVSSSNYYRNDLPFPEDISEMRDSYGKKPFPNFLAGLDANVVMSKWIVTVCVQYEHSGGSLRIDSAITPSGSKKVNGKYSRIYDFISTNPQVGRILIQKKVTLALHTGIDYCSMLEWGERFDWTDQNGQVASTLLSGGRPDNDDLRITFGATVAIKKWTLGVNYKHGVANCDPSGELVYSRLLQFRLQYTFLSKRI